MSTLRLALALLSLSVVAEEAGDAQHGKALYKERCIACHSVNYNGVGPAHKGVFGRIAGAATNYPYSAALKASGITWTPQNLDRWLSDPEKFVPGQKMGFSVADAQERADLIAYLKTLSQ